MSYIYVNQSARSAPPKPVRLSKIKKKYIAIGFFGVGIFLFASAIIPIIRFQLEYSIKFNRIINPLSSQFYNNSGNILGEMTADYSQLSNWFVSDSQGGPESKKQMMSPEGASTYSISIPKLKIINAYVTIGSMDLKKSLIQYPQTALPGQLGNTVIFGHSVLPQFFNPKSYITIFATLYRLNPGDEIFIDFDNVQYKYIVEEMYEVQATDLSVLEQRFDGRNLTLITCSPPGTYLRRLVVKAKIADN